MKFAPFYTLFTVIVFYIFRLYNSIWRFASFSELNRILGATGVTTLFHVIGITAFLHRMPVSYYVVGAVTQFCLVTAIRFSYRFVILEKARRDKNLKSVHNAMIIGAGAAGLVILKDLHEDGEDILSTLDPDEELERVYDLFMENLCDDEE